MSPNTIKIARAELVKRLKDASTYNPILGQRKNSLERKIKSLELIQSYLKLIRLENHLHKHWDKEEIRGLCCLTLKELKEDKSKHPLAREIKQILIHLEGGDTKAAVDALTRLENDPDQIERELNRIKGNEGGKNRSPFRTLVDRILERDGAINREELWERLGSHVGGDVIISITDEDIEVYAEEDKNNGRDRPIKILKPKEITKYLSDAKKALAQKQQQI